MKPRMQILNSVLTLGCLTNKLHLLMLLNKQSPRLSYLKVWDDAAGSDEIQGTGKARSQIVVYVFAAKHCFGSFLC
jgi:hypothetical protein